MDNFKGDFLNVLIFLHLQISDFQIVVNSCQILLYPNKPCINGKLTYSAFMWCINFNVIKLTHMTGFVIQGHIYNDL